MAIPPKKKDAQMQYYSKVAGALNSIFDKESEHYIDVFKEDFNFNEFLHVLATRVPQMVFAKLSGDELDPLQFNHLCNTLIMQDRIDNSK